MKKRTHNRIISALISCVMLASFTLALPAGAFFEYSQNDLTNYRLEHYNPDDGWVGMTKWDGEPPIITEYIYNDELGEAVLKQIFYTCKPDEKPNDLVIPDTIEGYRVTSIFPTAFQWTGFETVTVPEGVRDIGDWGFGRCSNLHSIILPESLEKIGAYAFWHDDSLTEVVIPDNVGEIGEGAFEYCYALTDLTLPESLTEIPDNLCRAAVSLVNVNIPDGVKSIGDNAFAACHELAEINIPDGVETIGDFAFNCCDVVTKIEIPDSVTEIGMDAFRSCLSATQVELSKSLETVAPYAFADCPNLEAVIIPEGVKSIEHHAFNVTPEDYHFDVGNIVNVEGGKIFALYLPSTIESIGEYAFTCQGPMTIYYGGTEEEWANVEIADYNDEVLNATVIFLGGDNGDDPGTGVEEPAEKIAGDVNGDGKVNAKDLTRFLKYLAGNNVEVVEEALDMNCDGKINSKDLIRLLKYMAGDETTTD